MTALLGTYDHYGYAAIALLGTFFGAWFLLWVTLRSPWAEEIHTWRGVSPPRASAASSWRRPRRLRNLRRTPDA